jgi:tRNA-specific 2-thiouridylase
MKIFVALSGGVDSAVAAHILKQEGHNVTGVFIRVWQPDFLPCSQDEEERAALRVAAHIGIPFKRLNLSDEYKRDVVDRMIIEYAAGRTPNPDVLCNATIKFGAFLNYALLEGACAIATGHHARVREKGGVFQLLRGTDVSKDQAYFLWKLAQKELGRTLMPVGEMTKRKVRSYAKEHKIPSATKPDSQGLCFIGHVDMKDFLKNFIETEPGRVLDESGTVIGSHEGAELVTLGQRSGFTVTEKSAQGPIYYVVAKNIHENTVTVSSSPLSPTRASKVYRLTDTNWIREEIENKKSTCEIRYRGKKIGCRVTRQDSTDARIELDTAVLVASGQSLVVYDADVCVGGGIVA